jgi:hypothetical protein
MSLKILQITIPEDNIIPEIQDFNPEENYLMLKIGSESLIKGRKCAVILSQKDIYDKIKQESRIEIEELEMKMVIEKESSRRLEEIAKEMYENQIGCLESRIKQLNTEIVLYEKNNESEIKVEIEKTKEKYAAEIEKIRENSELLLKEKDIQNQMNRAAFDSALQLLNRQKTIVEKGKEGEEDFFELASHIFRDFTGFEIENMAKQSHKGDFHLSFENFKILVDMKNYTNNVGKKEIDKIEKDLLDNEGMNFAWLISLNTDISGWNRCPIMFKWILSSIGPKCIFFINYFNKNPEYILRTLWAIAGEFYKLSKNPEETGGYEEVKELKKDFKDKKYILGKHIKNLQENANEIRKNLNSSMNVLRQINTELIDMLSIISDEIVSVIKKYDKIEEWFSNKVEEVGDDNIKLTSMDIWNRFKRENKEYIAEKKITVEIFKQEIKNIVNTSKCIDKIKAFELIGYRFKKEKIIIENIVVEIKDKKSKKSEYYFDKERDHQVLELYQIESNNIMNISNENNIRPWQVVSILQHHKKIINRKDARGYDLYKETDEYNNKIKSNMV